MVFTGVGVALLTLFDESRAVDVDASAAHAARLVDLGVSAIIVAGTTGEPMALTRFERIALLSAVCDAVSVPVVAGTGAPSPDEALQYSLDAVEAGADAILALSPPAPVDVGAYYATLVEAVDLPVMAYHFPAVSSPGFEPERVAGFGVVGVKDSSGDPKRLYALLESFDGAVYPGSPFLVKTAGEQGAAGAILAIANLMPEVAVSAFDGDAKAQREMAATALSMPGNRWTTMKAAVAERFGTSPVTRMA